MKTFSELLTKYPKHWFWSCDLGIEWNPDAEESQVLLDVLIYATKEHRDSYVFNANEMHVARELVFDDRHLFFFDGKNSQFLNEERYIDGELLE